jgi:endogenous inhibitor of DNA gyrase (YacG/DUF329 family)
MHSRPRVVSCPTCDRQVLWTQDSVWRPFCSERCKLIDLGAWATEQYRVPVTESNDAPEESAPGEPPVLPGSPRAQ